MIDHYNLSRVMRKPAFCICENKDADRLCSNCAADQRLCFRYTDSTIHLLHKAEISSLYQSSMVVQPGLCQTWSEIPKTGFLATRLISFQEYLLLVIPTIFVPMKVTRQNKVNSLFQLHMYTKGIIATTTKDLQNKNDRNASLCYF